MLKEPRFVFLPLFQIAAHVELQIGPFDEKFNAITGLNGSGKSNILDAICFVLGITNLRQVRVTDMAGLVYKKGHGGIKKATVTLVFNNGQSIFSSLCHILSQKRPRGQIFLTHRI